MTDMYNPGLGIRQIRRVRHVGKVYNLAIHEDASYIAEGVVVHNCRCRVIARRENVGGITTGSTISGLPDAGFTSGTPTWSTFDQRHGWCLAFLNPAEPICKG